MSEEQTKAQQAQESQVDKEPKAEPKENPVIKGLADLKEEVKSMKENEANKASALQEHINKQQSEALEFFQDEGKKKALLGGMNQQEANQLLEDIEKGKVTRRELEVRAKYGIQQIVGPKEATNAPVVKPTVQGAPSGEDFDSISKQLLNMQKDPNNPIHNPNHKDHFAAKEKYEKLDKRREQLVS